MNTELKIRAEMCQPRVKDSIAKLSAIYKIGDIKAVASCDMNSDKQLTNSNLMLKTTLDI